MIHYHLDYPPPTESLRKPDHLQGTMEAPSTEDPKVRSFSGMRVSVRASPFSSVCASAESSSDQFQIPGHCQRCAWHHVKTCGPQVGAKSLEREHLTGRRQGQVSNISWMGSDLSIQHGACVWLDGGLGQEGGLLMKEKVTCITSAESSILTESERKHWNTTYFSPQESELISLAWLPSTNSTNLLILLCGTHVNMLRGICWPWFLRTIMPFDPDISEIFVQIFAC